MLPKKWMTLTTTFLLVFLLVAGYISVMAQYGSQSDPIVTVSYINDVLSQEISKKTDEIIGAKTSEFTANMDKKLKEFSESVDDKLAMYNNDYSAILQDQNFINSVAAAIGGSSSAGTATLNTDYKVVKVAKGKTLTGNVGTEILLRFGSASCAASGSPGLINITTGGVLENGGALAANNLYLVTVESRGFKATADATVLVRGTYSIK